MPSWSDLVEVFRLYPRIVPMVRLARREAEALVYRFGSEGVEVARERERQMLICPRSDRLYAWLVRSFAERGYEYLTGLDTGTRYEVLAAWEFRTGQMITAGG